MKKLMVLALVAVTLTGCGSSSNGCPESLPVLEAEQVAGFLPMPAPAPRPPAPAPRPAAPRPAAPAPKPAAPKPAAPPKVQAPKPPPRYNIPPRRPYTPPRFVAPPTVHHYHQDSALSSPYFWMLMMQNSSLHNTAHTEGCTR